MKKTLNLLLFALLANILLQAQSNNPYNQTGIDFTIL